METTTIRTADSNKDDTLRYRRIRYILFRDTVILLIGVSYALFVYYTGIAVPCIFHKITGLMCPGCGISRACMSLLKGHVAEAFSYNPFLMLASPVILYLIVKCDLKYVSSGNYTLNKPDTVITYILIAIAIVFAVCRNVF